MRKILFILSIFVFGISYSQENVYPDCNLQIENEQWKIKFEKTESKTERISLIKQKIKSDSIYSLREPKFKISHSITWYNEQVDEKGNDCGCKILFILYYSKKNLIILNLNSKPELSSILKELNSENIDLFYSFDKLTAQTLYGTSSKCGFIQMTLKDNKIKRKIKRKIKNVW